MYWNGSARLLAGCHPDLSATSHERDSIGTIFAFALSSPLFDPLSLLYWLILSKPFTIFAFATASLVVVTVSGGIFDKLFPDTELDIPPPQNVLLVSVELHP